MSSSSVRLPPADPHAPVLPASAQSRLREGGEEEAARVTDSVTPSDRTSRLFRSPLGIAKELIKRPGLEVDLGAYLTQDYEELFRGRLDPQLGVGLSVSF